MKTSNSTKSARKRMMPPKQERCDKCGMLGPHFVPPSLREEGFYLCDYMKHGIEALPAKKEEDVTDQYPGICTLFNAICGGKGTITRIDE